jgi:flavin reductase (DIM6/NTAB) family NADH-FMN oxidoreductase RutF
MTIQSYDTQAGFPVEFLSDIRNGGNGYSSHDISSTTASVHFDAFRFAMRRVATSVTIVTAIKGGVDYGMTATAFAPVSMAPPMLLVIVNETAAIYRPLVESGRFCLNILGAEQEYIAQRFSAKPSDQSRFQSGQWLKDSALPARLLGAQGWIDCAVESAIPAGTHSIFVGKVTGAHSPKSGTPLLYLDGRYAHVSG